MKTEYFVVSNSFAAPFVSETTYCYIEGESPAQALQEYGEKVRPYSADVYWTADDYHKGLEPVAKYLCNYEIVKQKAVKGLNAFTYKSHGENMFTINDKEYYVDNPRDGIVI